VYSLALRHNLTGWVRNTSAGVQIGVEGRESDLDSFAKALGDQAPPLARINRVVRKPAPANGYRSFEIQPSRPIPGAFLPISPDVSICKDCLKELFDPADRRFRYPFINCTHCGPRFTIIDDIPYDRAKTTMAGFDLCAACAAEYRNPRDRRFHAQPVACPVCGPHVWLAASSRATAAISSPEIEGDLLTGESAIQAARAVLSKGGILAVKGLGGFHLACDASDAAAVGELRRRKLRAEKPFALMTTHVGTASHFCFISPDEAALLTSRERPIVILQRRPGSNIVGEVAPGQLTLGVMLPYTPLHHLLLEPEAGFPEAVVMTSGNLSEEPISHRNQHALERLAPLADYLLLHDRGIRTRCDDSVVRAANGGKQGNSGGSPIQLRRSRGYAPLPISLPWEGPPILATGAELKNSFCLTKGELAFLSHHIGDMENYETLTAFEQGIEHFERLFRVIPEAIITDLHPDYLATRYGLERANREAKPCLAVQHHHAHIASCMAEHGHPGDRPVIGVAFDGTGYGEDGTIWGGEFLLANYLEYRRVAHLEPVRLPGGDKAIREPWRMGLAWMEKANTAWSDDMPPVSIHETDRPLRALKHQLRTGLNAPYTSSAGRLFDAVASLAGVRQKISYEAQGAIELENMVDPDEPGIYPFECMDGIIGVAPFIRLLVADLRSGVSKSQIAARFHNGLAHMVLEVCRSLRQSEGVTEVVLSGGVWQNMVLFSKTVELLRGDKFMVLYQRQVPANDGGLALGQAAIGSHRLLET
jgi:hydrogenase maturation protein HypF